MPVEEEDPLTLQQRTVWVYSSQEQRQSWQQAGAGLMDGGDGVSMWLPNNVVATVRTLPAPAPASSPSDGAEEQLHDAGSNGGVVTEEAAAARAPKGLMFSFWWLVSGGTAMMVEREYDGQGNLVEVRHGSAVKGGWAGGKM